MPSLLAHQTRPARSPQRLVWLLFALVTASPPLFAQDSNLLSIGNNRLGACGVIAGQPLSCALRFAEERLAPPADLPALVQVTAGETHFCGVDSSSQPVCWGDNDFGQLNIPPDVLAASDISAGMVHICMVNLDGSLRCWGLPSNGWLDAPAGANFTAVESGDRHSCALTDADQISCWGSEEFGVNEGPTGSGPWQAVDVSGGRACALDTSGTIECWGIPVLPPQGGPYTEVAVGGPSRSVDRLGMVCGVRPDTTLDCRFSTAVNGARATDIQIDPDEYGITPFFPFDGVARLSGAPNSATGCSVVGSQFVCWGVEAGFPSDGYSSPLPPTDLSATRYSDSASTHGSCT